MDSVANSETILNYKGAFTYEIMEKLLKQLRSSSHFRSMRKIPRKRLYSTFVESIDNIFKYATRHVSEKRRGPGAPMISVVKRGNRFLVISGNVVLNEDIEDLRFKLDRVNQLDHEALKSLYEDIINRDADENDTGAGLGLITMALRTENDITYSFTSLDRDHSFFKMQIIING